jgi:hypothetical protein
MIKIKHNYNFVYNNDVGLYMKFQKWKDNCLERYDEAKLIMIVRINKQGFEEIYDKEEEYDYWDHMPWVDFELE